MQDTQKGRKWHIESSLLADGGTLWTNLGIWPSTKASVDQHQTCRESTPSQDVYSYVQACQELATRVGLAADLKPADRVLEIACGYGASISHWVETFGVRQVDAIDIRPACIEHLKSRRPLGLGLAIACPAQDLLTCVSPSGALPRHGYDAVVCVDAAYHFGDPRRIFDAVATLLRPGGSFAWTSLLRETASSKALFPALSNVLLKLASIPPKGLLTPEETTRYLATYALDLTARHRLDSEVLEGFQRFVNRRSKELPWHRKLSLDWLKIRGTGHLSGRLVSQSSLHYELLVARRRSAS